MKENKSVHQNCISPSRSDRQDNKHIVNVIVCLFTPKLTNDINNQRNSQIYKDDDEFYIRTDREFYLKAKSKNDNRTTVQQQQQQQKQNIKLPEKQERQKKCTKRMIRMEMNQGMK